MLTLMSNNLDIRQSDTYYMANLLCLKYIFNLLCMLSHLIKQYLKKANQKNRLRNGADMAAIGQAFLFTLSIS
jgi:hypothetical protein